MRRRDAFWAALLIWRCCCQTQAHGSALSSCISFLDVTLGRYLVTAGGLGSSAQRHLVIVLGLADKFLVSGTGSGGSGVFLEEERTRRWLPLHRGVSNGRDVEGQPKDYVGCARWQHAQAVKKCREQELLTKAAKESPAIKTCLCSPGPRQDCDERKEGVWICVPQTSSCHSPATLSHSPPAFPYTVDAAGAQHQPREKKAVTDSQEAAGSHVPVPPLQNSLCKMLPRLQTEDNAGRM